MTMAVLQWAGVNLIGVDSVFAPTDAWRSEVSFFTFVSGSDPSKSEKEFEEKHHRKA